VRWRCFPLHPEVPEEGISIARLFNKSDEEVKLMGESLAQTAKRFGVSLGPIKNTFNTRLAQEVGVWAQQQGKGHEFHMEAFKAFFNDGKNLASKDVLMGLAESVGLSKPEASDVIEKRLFSDEVDKDWELAAEMAIQVVPTLTINGMKQGGAQPYEQILNFVRRAGNII
jgi:predicted DsbA family dithiol-disulfide isomerase